MKKTIYFLAALFFAASLTAQYPEKMSYQAIVRNSSNALITNHLIGMKISILQGSATGSVVYSELQTATSNANGLITIIIGNGMPVYCTFSCIDWTLGTYFIKTEIDPGGGTNYTISGTTQLLYVPYAVYAKTAEISKKTTPVGAAGQVQFSNGVTLGSDADLFWDNTQKRLGIGTSNAAAINCPLDVRNEKGDAIHGVSYDNGSGVYGTEYSSSFGNAGCGVSGRSTSDGGIGVKGYSDLNTGTTYGVYGLVASPDGYGVYGISTSSGTGVYGEGSRGVVGNSNSITGYTFGVRGSVFSSEGIAIKGDSYSQTGNTVGVYGTSSSISGIGIYGFSGAASGITKGVVGYINSPDGFSGYFAGGKFHVRGKVGVGTETPGAGIHLKGTGYPDSFMFIESATGNDAGFRIYEGATAKWHIFNDVNAGGLRMYNTGAVTAIFCKQSNSFVGINTLTPAYNLDVNGTAGKTGGGSWSTSSDIRLKDVTGNYAKGLKEVVALQPVSFVYKKGNTRHLPTDIPQIGFVAQEVQKIFPEAVTKGEDGYLDFNIHAINVALVNAIKELKNENEELKSENRQLKLISEKNDKRLTEIENTLRNNIKK